MNSIDPVSSLYNSQRLTTVLKAFSTSCAITILSELGDKTFFIAAILSMKEVPGTVFLGASSALIVMTLLAIGIGSILPIVLSPRVTQFISTILFFFFGCRLFYETFQISSTEIFEGFDKVQKEIGLEENASKEMEVFSVLDETETQIYTVDDADKNILSRRQLNSNLIGLPSRLLDDSLQEEKFHNKTFFIKKFLQKENFKDFQSIRRQISYALEKYLSTAFLQAFSLTFVAEWGDRSQVTTVAMAATSNWMGITLGTILGHAFCTGVAVVGGRILASKINERTVTLLSSVLFILFGLNNLLK